MSTTDNTGGKPGQAPASETQTDVSQQSQDETASETPANFGEWLSKQDASTQGLIESGFTPIRSALQSERDARKDMEKQLKKLSKTADQGSDLQKEIDRLAGELRGQTMRADFLEEAGKAGVESSKLKYALHIVKADGLMDDRGRVDFADLKKAYPELFASERKANVPPGNAGNGTREGPPKQALSGNAAVNYAIRKAAGRV